ARNIDQGRRRRVRSGGRARRGGRGPGARPWRRAATRHARRGRPRVHTASRRSGHGRTARRLRGGVGVGDPSWRWHGHVALPSIMSARRRILRSALVIALVVTTAEAATSEHLSLAARAARFPRVDTATADFAQEREVSLVEDVLHARGTL